MNLRNQRERERERERSSVGSKIENDGTCTSIPKLFVSILIDIEKNIRGAKGFRLSVGFMVGTGTEYFD